ncbi:MAG: glutamine-hydrolyzing carbamoyl-phosphate synthase small subunit [Desulfobacterales bacterium]|nr:glutamine-hydrolyzing carbamoyl-phosphate synthase small subunit [Desulfobacterales bacterium]
MKALLALEDGRTFPCRSFTGSGEAFGEVVFNTSMTGYQEILTDPSYRGQIVTMTYPLIGNYGVNDEDVESDRIQASAFIVREYQPYPSNFRSTQPLADYLKAQGVLGIEDLDTRALTRHIRSAGAMQAAISTVDLNPDSLVKKARNAPALIGRDLVQTVTTVSAYHWRQGKAEILPSDQRLDETIWPKGAGCRVAAMDFGIKYNILRCLESAGCRIVVVPAKTPAETIRALAPDGVFLSNGPGDPSPVTYAVETIRSLMGFRPIFGICLGIQLIALALGGKTFKLKFGHRGGNQPVKDLDSGKVEITSQNHGFAVDINSLNTGEVRATHINLNDNTLEGFRHLKLPVMAVQYHPEASPGPHDSVHLFDQFVSMMKHPSSISGR